MGLRKEPFGPEAKDHKKRHAYGQLPQGGSLHRV
jgi:hypothetical protein